MSAMELRRQEQTKRDEAKTEYCVRCKQNKIARPGLCIICTIRMTPKVYACDRCRRPFKKSVFEIACEDCRTDDEQKELLENWIGGNDPDDTIAKAKALSRFV